MFNLIIDFLLNLIKIYISFCNNFFFLGILTSYIYIFFCNLDKGLIIICVLGYIVFWQFFILIFICCYEFFLYFNKNIKNKKLLKDNYYLMYVKFLNELLYNFYYILIKFYIKLSKKKKNYFFIFLRWIFLITPFYWGFFLFFFYVYFIYVNTLMLIRIMCLNSTNIFFMHFLLFFESFYNLINPFLIKLYDTWIYKNRIGRYLFWRNFYNVSSKKIYVFVYWNSFYFWFKLKKIYKFFRYKLYRLIYLKFFRKNLWIWRILKIKYYFKIFFKCFKFKQIFLLNIKFHFLNIRFQLNLFILKIFNKFIK